MILFLKIFSLIALHEYAVSLTFSVIRVCDYPMDSKGLLIEGFDYPQPMTMMDYTFPSYVDMVVGYGFEKRRDIYSYYVFSFRKT